MRISGIGRASLVGLAAALVGLAAPALAAEAPDAFARATAELQRADGLLPLYLDRKAARILIALKPDADGLAGEYIYQIYMRAGLGSTPIGIDRSNPGPTRILEFRRVGPKVYAELENFAFRADRGSTDEREAVRESFPPSIVWSGDVLATAPDGTFLVDISSFITRDAFGVADDLKRAGQGTFHLATDRSYPDLGEAHAFPENLELEARQTFVSDDPGKEVGHVAPEPHAVTLVEHHSLIKLPEPGFTPRFADPRTGAFDEVVADYSAPLGAPSIYRLAKRFRLEKTDPTAARSPVKKPIVFYVDRAAPEPIRSALVEGARWWSEAFDAAGFEDAFRVEVLPEGVNPLDARYNVINWVHRQTRGWSYGYAVADPRTGEIVKGNVLLGSLRVRQDIMIFQGLLGADKTGSGGPDDPLQIALARLRQLAVHETGHALGLEHNFAGSTFDDRASVMDYPAPRVKIVGDGFDLSDAYQVGVGAWDRFAIKWLYSEVPPGPEGQAALETIIRDGYARDHLRYVRDEDARPIGSSQPFGAMWDDGPDSVASLIHVMEVRKIALAKFGPTNIPEGARLSDLRRVIVPIYLFHRYEVESAAKSVGGVDFAYGVRGDAILPNRPVDGARQRQALSALLATLDPAFFDLPDPLLDQLSAGREGADDRQYVTELFGDPDSPVFDIDEAARAAADITLANLLEPSRLERVRDQGARDPGQLALTELLDRTIGAAFSVAPLPARQAQLRRVVQMRLVTRLAHVLEDKSASPEVKAAVKARLDQLAETLARRQTGDPADIAQDHYLARAITNPARDELASLAAADKGFEPPPGMPIGEAGEACWFCDALPAGQ
ncbi:MAG TPA: zinc-dependent metalloprotease [Caulobacteraceae bacterium]|nr:zinc-dependent metalloprotease [Caulobacteraceae bacterium]